jgi:hypothetical protein
MVAINKKIISGQYPNCIKLAKEYEVDVSTINRDIGVMKSTMGAPIRYDPLRNGYYYTDKSYSLPDEYVFEYGARGDEQQFSLAFFGESREWARKQKWGVLSIEPKIEECFDEVREYTLISFTSRYHDRVLRMVLSQCEFSCPLAPAQLVSNWRFHASEMEKALKLQKSLAVRHPMPD